jgi:radical SAM protein with 4Fe4S-binding SPASM domain
MGGLSIGDPIEEQQHAGDRGRIRGHAAGTISRPGKRCPSLAPCARSRLVYYVCYPKRDLAHGLDARLITSMRERRQAPVPELHVGQSPQSVDAKLLQLIERNDFEGFKDEFTSVANVPEQHIIRAASLGRVRLLEYLLANIPTSERTRVAAFRESIRAGQLDTITFLHRTGIDLNSSAPALLDDAIANGSVDAVRYLHQNGISLSIASVDAMTLVARRGHVLVLKYLHTNGMRITEIGPHLLTEAVRNGRVGLIKYLLHQAGIPLGHVTLEDLLITIEHGHLQTLRYLARSGVDLEGVKRIVLNRDEITFPELAEFLRGSNEIVHPSVITIDNHRSCNAACRMCPTQPFDAGSGAMTEPVFRALLSQIADFKESVQSIIFGVHGEPLLDKHLERRVSELREIGIEDIRVNTNGSALTAERARKLIQAGTRSIAISVDGFTAETYEAVRIGLRYKTVVTNIENLIRIRNELGASMNITLRMIIQTTNVHEVDAWHEHWNERLHPQLDGFHFQPVHNWAYRTRERSDFGTTPCLDVTNTVVISHDGKIPLCCLDHRPEYDFGNILSHHLLDIYNNAQWKKVRSTHLKMERNTLRLCDSCAFPEERLNTTASASQYRDVETAFNWQRT